MEVKDVRLSTLWVPESLAQSLRKMTLDMQVAAREAKRNGGKLQIPTEASIRRRILMSAIAEHFKRSK